jgi:hypothetical protein
MRCILDAPHFGLGYWQVSPPSVDAAHLPLWQSDAWVHEAPIGLTDETMPPPHAGPISQYM